MKFNGFNKREQRMNNLILNMCIVRVNGVKTLKRAQGNDVKTIITLKT